MIRRAGGLAEEALTYSIIGAFRDAYNELGEGWLESVYANALERELTNRGHHVAREVAIQVYYKGEPIFGAKPKHSREFCSNERLRIPQEPSDLSA